MKYTEKRRPRAKIFSYKRSGPERSDKLPACRRSNTIRRSLEYETVYGHNSGESRGKDAGAEGVKGSHPWIPNLSGKRTGLAMGQHPYAWMHTYIFRPPARRSLTWARRFCFLKKRANRLKGDIYYGHGCNQFSRQ